LGPAKSTLKNLDGLFACRHFDRDVIILCVRWHLRYKLSLRDLVEMMAERGLALAHTTILRGVRRYTPEFVKRWSRFAMAAGRSWRVDETYLKTRGNQVYLYRAADRSGQCGPFQSLRYPYIYEESQNRHLFARDAAELPLQRPTGVVQ
jgi:transposase-like protein